MHSEQLRRLGIIGCGQPLIDVGSGRNVEADGYVRVYRPGHPMAHGDGWAPEHRVVAWEIFGSFARLHGEHNRKVDPAEAARLYQSGLSTIAVAKLLGSHPGNISRMLAAQGVPARKKRP